MRKPAIPTLRHINNYRTICMVIVALAAVPRVLAQQYFQNVKGKIADRESGLTIPGVIVKMKGDTSRKLSAVSDENGVFKITGVPVGRRTFIFALVGYKPYVATDIMVVSGKEVFLNIEMEEAIQEIGEVVISADDKGINNEMSSVSTKTFSIEETERYPGSRQDPARMASNFAGVQGTNDSRNDIVIRGNSPSGLLWRLEEIDIPNPNHFNIAGSAGGPVSIINNKYLSNSEFFTGAFPASYGNALGGVFDLKMRNGNNEKHERTFQLGIMGTELAFEGPLNKSKGSSYMVNYRYSTLDLFSFAHIKIGTSAVPRYQDGAFRFNFPTKKAGTFSISGIGGLSTISIILSKDTVRPKELYGDQNRDQYFSTNLGVIIANHVISLGEKTLMKTSLAHSVSYISADHNLILRDRNYKPNDTLPQILDFAQTEQKTTLTSYIKHKINARNSFKTGFYVNYFQATYFDRVKQNAVTDTLAGTILNKAWKNRLGTSATYFLIQPYFQYNFKLNDQVTFNAGVFGQLLTLNNSYAVEPRAGVKWSINSRNMLSFGYGLHSQIQPGYIYFACPDSVVRNGVVLGNGGSNGENKIQDNRNLGMSKSQHFVLGYDLFLSRYFRIKAETYYQNLWNIPVYAVPSSVSMLNRGATFSRFFPIYTMENKGTGLNYGIELTVEKLFHNHYFFLFSGSVFNSKYKGSNGKEWDTDFNGNYIFNLLAGLEYGIGRSKKNAITFGPKFTYGGGRRYTMPDRAASDRIMDVVPVNDPVNNLQFPNYFRIDSRIAYKINGKKADYEIAVDLVNITNQKNVLALTYSPDPQNPQADPMIRNYQLGFLPLFYFKVNF
ncbi:MAG: TonB-dependent receptor [Bacteroidia bacterium]